jgi:hypothetical protein
VNKKEILFIRACKSKNPIKRLKTLHNKIYGYKSETQTEKNLINDLAGICQNCELMGVADLICEMSRKEDQYLFFNQKTSFSILCLESLISKIRFAKVDKFPGFISPAKFK